jgi:pantothenate kinase
MNMQEYIADPVARLLKMVPPVGGARVVVGLVGLPGAGKSTQARQWTEEVNARSGNVVMQCVGMDGFHFSLDDLARLPFPQNDQQRRGAPWTFDAHQLAFSLQALRQTTPSGQQADVLWPDFDHAVGDPVADAIPIQPSIRLVLVEGLYLLLPEPRWGLREMFDHTWFLDEDMATAMGRLVQRHCRSWGITEAEARQRIDVNDRLNAGIADRTRSFAQALVAPTSIHSTDQAHDRLRQPT